MHATIAGTQSGWDYNGLYKITDPQKAETVKSELQKFLNRFKPFNDGTMVNLCESVRLLKESEENTNFYEFEYKMFRLAGITDPNNASDEELKNKMSFLWDKHYKDFECKYETRIYPKGNFLRQLARVGHF